MPSLYTFDIDTADELTTALAERFKRRRLEKGLSRDAVSQMSGVPAPTIAKFEQKHAISLGSFVSLAKALGYTDEIKHLLSEPIFHTMDEMVTIKRNKDRKRGRNEFGK